MHIVYIVYIVYILRHVYTHAGVNYTQYIYSNYLLTYLATITRAIYIIHNVYSIANHVDSIHSAVQYVQ